MTRELSRRRLLASAGLAFLGTGGGALAIARAQPGAGARKRARHWGLAVDLQMCLSREGCRACVDECHQRHRVGPPAEPRHEITWIGQAPFERAFPEPSHPWMAPNERERAVPVLCNHCASPPCTRVCPTGATWRREDGIVAMDPHRCIGCRYCMAACPYGARSFNWSAPVPTTSGEPYPTRQVGVVEKCTLCADRIDGGSVPWCVEACQQRGGAALLFGDLRDPDSELRRALATRHVLRRRPSLGTEPSLFYLV